MYFDIQETLVNKRNLDRYFDSRNINIIDFFPYMNKKNTPEVPCSAENHRKVFPLFSTVGEFDDFNIILTDPIPDAGICTMKEFDSIEYDFDLYEKELEHYKKILYDIGYDVESRPASELYDSFISAQAVCDISGLVCLEAKNIYPTNKTPIAIPCTVFGRNMPNIESYYTVINEHADDVALTLYTLLKMHEEAFNDLGLPASEVNFYQDYFAYRHPMLLRRRDTVTRIMNSILGKHTFDPVYIRDIINNEVDDAEFVRYYSIMSNDFDLREQEAKQMLVYHKDCVAQYDRYLRESMQTDRLTRNRILYLIPKIESGAEVYRSRTGELRKNMY